MVGVSGWIVNTGYVLVAVIFLAAQSFAATPDKNKHSEGDVNVDAGSVVGDTLIDTGGNSSLAVVAPGLGDVDIAQCLGSTQWSLLVGGKQKLVLNQVCMAEFYLKQGRYHLAAQSLCNQPEILAEYSTELDCELAHDFAPVIPDHDMHRRSPEFEETYNLVQEQEDEIHTVQMAQTDLEQRIVELEQRPVRRIVTTPKQLYSDEQRAAVLAAFKHE